MGFPVNFNSRTSCEVRPWPARRHNPGAVISTHAPLARCDKAVKTLQARGWNFNSRTSCEVRRGVPGAQHPAQGFQLTHLLRGATARCLLWYNILTFQLTHLLRGATKFYAGQAQILHFNSRTSCEVRLRLGRIRSGRWNFNSRTSCEVRPAVLTLYKCGKRISTHAPLARCDATGRGSLGRTRISTHAPLARCDLNRNRIRARPDNFNSRTSCEVRRVGNVPTSPAESFQLTHLLRGATDFRARSLRWF